MDERAKEIERVYRERYVGFRNTFAAVTGSYDSARDAVQEAFARALRERASFRGEGPLEAWIFRIALRTALEARRNGREVPFDDALDPDVLEAERDPELAAALRSLPPRRRLIVFLRYFAGLSCYAHNGGGGCLSPAFAAIIGGMGVQGGAAVSVCCAVSEGVATAELSYEDGRRTELRPVDGFLLYVIPPEHYLRGHRLETIVWRDADGREVARRAIATDAKGIYPCGKQEEIELGYGQTICP